MTPPALAAAIAQHDLAPHPFEGFFRETEHEAGVARQLLWLLPGDAFVPWHALPAQADWALRDGAPVTLSLSEDGQYAAATTLHAGRPAVSAAAGTFLTLASVGSWSLFKLRLMPDISVSTRDHCPDDWVPGR